MINDFRHVFKFANKALWSSSNLVLIGADSIVVTVHGIFCVPEPRSVGSNSTNASAWRLHVHSLSHKLLPISGTEMIVIVLLGMSHSVVPLVSVANT